MPRGRETTFVFCLRGGNMADRISGKLLRRGAQKFRELATTQCDVVERWYRTTTRRI